VMLRYGRVGRRSNTAKIKKRKKFRKKKETC